MPISGWSELLKDSGFTIDGIAEPRPTSAPAAAHPLLMRISEIPEFLVISAIRI
ncbi:MAG: hypothetical protein O3B95_09400 [Chloroflexi bacterium]|nr:hypothetical protein [Chloroflexota bacterium]